MRFNYMMGSITAVISWSASNSKHNTENQQKNS